MHNLVPMDVYLVRHAIADRRDPLRWPDDAERPLTPKGVMRFRAAARGLRRIVSDVDLVLASPYARSWQTAAILHREAGWPAPRRCPSLEPAHEPSEALELLKRCKQPAIALVGHEPNLSALASLLLTGDERAVDLELKKGGAALLALPAEATAGAAVLHWSVSPKILRALDGSGRGDSLAARPDG